MSARTYRTIIVGSHIGGSVINQVGGPLHDDKVADLLTKGLPQEEHPVVDLSRPIEDQLRLFPEDKIGISGFSDELTEVWFGKVWQPFDPARAQTYITWGPEGLPVNPKFKGRGMVKLSVSFTKYRDQRRDLRPGHQQDGLGIEKK